MKWLPSPPTDNLYKFMSIFGLWLLLGLVLLFAWLGYLNFQVKKEGERSQAYFISTNMELKISTRLASIKAKHFNENRLEWVLPDTGIEQEQKILQMALDNHRQIIEKNKDALNHNIDGMLEMLESMGFLWIMPIYVFLAVGCPYFGFTRWYRYIQKPSEAAHELDCRLKEATLRKIESEIRQSRPNKFSVTR